MKNENNQHLNNLKAIHQRRLRILEEQKAKFGDIHVPGHIVIEIEELKTKISDIDAQLMQLMSVDSNKKVLNEQKILANLRIKLTTHFNLEELQTLCFDLGIDSDNFPPLKEGFSRELISYSVRNEEISKLINYLQEKRPHVSW